MSINKSISAILNHMRQDGISIKEFRPHAFRHTFATRAIENGMNPKTLQKILGHSTLQMTLDLYCHVTEDTLFEEMKKMDK
jgi:site-specific recombinase XerD